MSIKNQQERKNMPTPIKPKNNLEKINYIENRNQNDQEKFDQKLTTITGDNTAKEPFAHAIKKYMMRFFPLAMWRVMLGYEHFTSSQYLGRHPDADEFEKHHKAGKSAIQHLDTLITAEKKVKDTFTEAEQETMRGDVSDADMIQAMENLNTLEEQLQDMKKNHL